MRIRADFPDNDSPPDLEVLQLHDHADLPSGHIYPHVQVFTPDSRFCLLQCATEKFDSERPKYRRPYFLCDIKNDCELTPTSIEPGGRCPCVSPDGRYIYYFSCPTHHEIGPIHLKRVGLHGSDPTTITTIDSPLPGCDARPLYPRSNPTVSSDGQRLAQNIRMNDKSLGIVVFYLATGSAELILHDASWSNAHIQYCQSDDPEESHDLMIQQCHCEEVPNPPGTHILQDVDIHVIRDDGADFRTMPWGRDGREYCMGHQCWRGRTSWAITSTITHLPTPVNPGRTECQLIESKPVPDAAHIGRNHQHSLRNDLTREFPNPQFYHFATDISGRNLISDYWHPDGHQKHPQGRQLLYLGRLSGPGTDPAGFTYLLDSRAAPQKTVHAHPFLSPDGRYAFFNSDESGLQQAYMIRNLPGT